MQIKDFFTQKIKISQSLICLLSTFVITFFYNFAFIHSKLTNTVIGGNSVIITLEITLEFFLIFLALYLASFNKIIFRFISFVILFLSGMAAYAINKFAISLDQTAIANLLDNASDIVEVLIFKDVFVYVIFYIIFPVLIFSKIEIVKDSHKKTVIIIAILLTIFTAILASFNHQIRKGIIFSYPPLNIINCCVEYFEELHSSRQEQTSLLPINDIVKAKISHKPFAMKVVLVIGESARSDHFSINGYQKETTPLIKKIPHFLSFKDVTPCNNITRHSVACMLSNLGSEKFSFPLKQESIIKIFEKLNFSTSWFSTQKAVGDNNTLMLLALQAQNYYFADHISAKIGGNMIYDEYLLDDLKKELQQPRDSFIILHTQGSHFLFDDRYPENFAKFQPTCNNKDLTRCSTEQIINSYDNTVSYTDYFLHEVIKNLKSQNALMIYVSDHGQFLGENGIYYHGKNGSHIEQEHRVPMFLWMSDKLLSDKFYKEKFNSAAKKTTQEISHDNLFSSLLNCSGISYNYHTTHKSICKK